MIITPRISLFNDFLDHEEWSIINSYCKENNNFFEKINRGTSVKWKPDRHSADPDFEFNRSFLISREQHDESKDYGDLFDVSIDFLKDGDVFSMLKNMLDKIQFYIEKIENKKLLRESGPWLTKMSAGDSMSMHCDGTFIHNKDHTSEYSIIYYINDDYDGGEFNMPKMGFKLKPKANSLLLFTNSFNENMAHEVMTVTSGDRYVSQSWYATVL
jgi:hypothetical protein